MRGTVALVRMTDLPPATELWPGEPCAGCGVTPADCPGLGGWAVLGSRRAFIERDHIRPVRYGGSDDLANLAPLCWWCNLVKADYWPGEVYHSFGGMWNSPMLALVILGGETTWVEDRRARRPHQAPLAILGDEYGLRQLARWMRAARDM
jgi:hypothetical protein